MTVAAARKLIASGRLPRHEPIVLVITGNGLKTVDAIVPTAAPYPVIEPRLEAFEGVVSIPAAAAAPSGHAIAGAPPSSGRFAPAAPVSSDRTL